MIDVSCKPERPEPVYMGDGVYARFDGYQLFIWITDGIYKGPEIAIDPDVLNNMVLYYRRCVGMS